MLYNIHIDIHTKLGTVLPILHNDIPSIRNSNIVGQKWRTI